MNFAEKYENAYQGSLEWIPEVTKALLERETEINRLIEDDRSLIATTDYVSQNHAIAFLKAANVMKKAVERDDIDNVNQNRKAFQCMDAYTGLLEEMWINEESFLTEAL